MHRRAKAEVLVGLVVMVMLVGLVGSPSGAGTILSAHLQIDDLDFVEPSSPNPDNPCAGGSSTLQTDFDPPDFFDVLLAHIEAAIELVSGDWWQVEVDYLVTIAPGTVTSGPTFYGVSGLDIALSLELVDVDDDDCTPVGEPCSGIFGLLVDGSIDTAPNPDVVSLTGDSGSSIVGDIDIQDTSCGGAVGPYQGAPVIVHHLIAEVP